MDHYDLIIIGGGVAGLSAGIYAGRYELSVLLAEGPKPGGETATGGKFENYPGIPSIDGFDLYQQFRLHAETAGTRIISGIVSAVEPEGKCFRVVVDGATSYHTASIVFAHGQ